jgi:phage shock protein PspC (stress-responsive transcriptional regulator)
MIVPVLAAMDRRQWFYTRDGERFGPTDIGGLRRMAQSLHLTQESTVWATGMGAWMQATSLSDLTFPSLPPELVPPNPVEVPMDARYDGLYRSSDDRVLLGLCGGMAHKWGIPATIVRLVFVGLAAGLVGFAYFAGVFAPELRTKNVPRTK